MKDHLICLCLVQDCLICQVFSAGLSYLSSVQCRTVLSVCVQCRTVLSVKCSVQDFLNIRQNTCLRQIFEETKLIFCRQRQSRGQPEARSLNYTTVS